MASPARFSRITFDPRVNFALRSSADLCSSAIPGDGAFASDPTVYRFASTGRVKIAGYRQGAQLEKNGLYWMPSFFIDDPHFASQGNILYVARVCAVNMHASVKGVFTPCMLSARAAPLFPQQGLKNVFSLDVSSDVVDTSDLLGSAAAAIWPTNGDAVICVQVLRMVKLSPASTAADQDHEAAYESPVIAHESVVKEMTEAALRTDFGSPLAEFTLAVKHPRKRAPRPKKKATDAPVPQPSTPAAAAAVLELIAQGEVVKKRKAEAAQVASASDSDSDDSDKKPQARQD